MAGMLEAAEEIEESEGWAEVQGCYFGFEGEGAGVDCFGPDLETELYGEVGEEMKSG